jgi:DNA invertase Pin-like site-specific DNA recombinase
MLRLLDRKKAAGVIIHKIDRSARNLRDWADLGELIDRGVEVHFAHESVDLTSRGGRLSADIQAVVAADYIRNLRDEVKKGFYGRLKQGYYPLPAPLGYRDNGGGQAKTPDPITAPLVRQAFESYATGRYNLPLLNEELYTLRSRVIGNKLKIKDQCYCGSGLPLKKCKAGRHDQCYRNFKCIELDILVNDHQFFVRNESELLKTFKDKLMYVLNTQSLNDLN